MQGRTNPEDRTIHRALDTNAVFVRPVSRGDGDGLRRMLSRLSRESLYMRFHMPYSRAPEWAVASFADPSRHEGESLVAVANGEVVGHAMYALSGVAFGTAEFAVVVEDGWQARGVGKLLLSSLAGRARQADVETFTGAVLGENRRMLGLIQAVFADARHAMVDGAYDVSAPLRSLRPAADPEIPEAARPLGLSA